MQDLMSKQKSSSNPVNPRGKILDFNVVRCNLRLYVNDVAIVIINLTECLNLAVHQKGQIAGSSTGSTRTDF